MNFDIMTLFPELVESILAESIIGRAQKNGYVNVTAHNIRDYSSDHRRRVDDTPYGGGMGMLISPQPVCDCYDAIVEGFPADERRLVIYMSPKGSVLTQRKAYELSREYDRLIILCGHYEGIDQRAIDEIVDEEISIGDYVLTGGELPACILVDCVSRMVENVLSNPECYENESISSGMLEYPQYTRPVEFRGKRVPDILQSGNHAEIERWRFKSALKETMEKRPELLGIEKAAKNRKNKKGK